MLPTHIHDVLGPSEATNMPVLGSDPDTLYSEMAHFTITMYQLKTC